MKLSETVKVVAAELRAIGRARGIDELFGLADRLDPNQDRRLLPLPIGDGDVPLSVDQTQSGVMTPDKLMALWNNTRGEKQPKVSVLNAARKRHARARIAEVRTRVGLAAEQAFWKELVTRIAASPAHNGKNNRGWYADFEYLLRENTWVRFVEQGGWFRPGASDGAQAGQDGPRDARGAREAVRRDAVRDVSVNDFSTPGNVE